MGQFSIAVDSGQFTRVEAFPEGEQKNILIGSFMSSVKDQNVVSHVYDAPYPTVWAKAKIVAQRFSKIGGRPLVAIDERTGRIQNGRITQDATVGAGGGAWLDEFLMEVTKQSDTQTEVLVGRKVVENEMNPATLQRSWRAQWSNSEIENWLLTQIEDELKK